MIHHLLPVIFYILNLSDCFKGFCFFWHFGGFHVASKALICYIKCLSYYSYSVFGPGWLNWQLVRTGPDWPEQSRLISQNATQPKLSEEHGRVEWIRALHRHGGFIRTCLESQGNSHAISWDSELQLCWMWHWGQY